MIEKKTFNMIPHLKRFFLASTFFGFSISLLGCNATTIHQDKPTVELVVYGMDELSHFTFDTINNTFSDKRIVDASNFGFGIKSKRNIVYSTGQGITTSIWDGEQFQHLANDNSFGSGTHISLNPTQEFLASASFRSGNTVVYTIGEDGTLIKDSAVALGSTDKSWAHWAGWNRAGDSLYVSLMGDNKIVVYPFDTKTIENKSASVGMPTTAWQGAQGDGPRHLAFHPKAEYAYIVNEISNTVVATQIQENGQLKPIQTLDLLPVNFAGVSRAAHIQISDDGQWVYISNRGQEGADSSLAVFHILSDGQLELVEHETGSPEKSIDTPRVFLRTTSHPLLFVANQIQGNILAFGIQQNGELDFLSSSQATARPFFILELE